MKIVSFYAHGEGDKKRMEREVSEAYAKALVEYVKNLPAMQEQKTGILKRFLSEMKGGG